MEPNAPKTKRVPVFFQPSLVGWHPHAGNADAVFAGLPSGALGGMETIVPLAAEASAKRVKDGKIPLLLDYHWLNEVGLGMESGGGVLSSLAPSINMPRAVSATRFAQLMDDAWAKHGNGVLSVGGTPNPAFGNQLWFSGGWGSPYSHVREVKRIVAQAAIEQRERWISGGKKWAETAYELEWNANNSAVVPDRVSPSLLRRYTAGTDAAVDYIVAAMEAQGVERAMDLVLRESFFTEHPVWKWGLEHYEWQFGIDGGTGNVVIEPKPTHPGVMIIPTTQAGILFCQALNELAGRVAAVVGVEEAHVSGGGEALDQAVAAIIKAGVFVNDKGRAMVHVNGGGKPPVNFADQIHNGNGVKVGTLIGSCPFDYDYERENVPSEIIAEQERMMKVILDQAGTVPADSGVEYVIVHIAPDVRSAEGEAIELQLASIASAEAQIAKAVSDLKLAYDPLTAARAIPEDKLLAA